MPRPIWSSKAVLRCRVHILWLKYWNLSLSRSRVSLRLHLCDWGAGINVTYRLHTILTTFTMLCTIRTISHWGRGQVLHFKINVKSWPWEWACTEIGNLKIICHVCTCTLCIIHVHEVISSNRSIWAAKGGEGACSLRAIEIQIQTRNWAWLSVYVYGNNLFQ